MSTEDGDHLSLIRTPVSASDFRKLKLIGKGDVGKVFLVEWVGHDRYFALKRLSKADMVARNKVRRVKEEREILASARHPFILTLYFAFHDEDHLYYITELCAGNLYEINRMIGPLSDTVVKQYAAQVLSALEYLHLLGVAYRDLKPENILIGLDGHIRLSDFDLSRKSQSVCSAPFQTTSTPFRSMLRIFGNSNPTPRHFSVSTHSLLSATSLCGTPEYLAPEVIAGPYHSATVDWWALGVLIYELLSGHTPFHGNTQEAIFNAVKSGHIRFPDHIPLSSEAKSLIKKLLVLDPEKRLGSKHGASEIKLHKFFKNIDFQLLRAVDPPIDPRTVFRGFYDYLAELEDVPKKVPNVVPNSNSNKEELNDSCTFSEFSYTSIDILKEIQRKQSR
ncbi:hypothetical protein P9112_014671 [Eukaryota sp. TZLM1-RC]